MIRLNTNWDDDLWQWTLSPEGLTPDARTSATSSLAVLRTTGVRVIVDRSTGTLLEVTVDATDGDGQLDESTAAAVLDLTGVVPSATGQVVVLDDGRHSRLLDLAASAAPGADADAGEELEWPVDLDGAPEHIIDRSTVTARLDAERGVLSVTATVEPSAYPPAVASVRAELVDADGLVVAFAPFRLSTNPAGPAAIAELIVSAHVHPDRHGLRVCSDSATEIGR